MGREHITDMPYCWCKPRQQVVNGNIITIHRCDTCHKDECHQLQYLRYMLGCEVTGDAHSAGGDVAVLKAVWEALIAFDGEDAIVERFRRNVQT